MIVVCNYEGQCRFKNKENWCEREVMIVDVNGACKALTRPGSVQDEAGSPHTIISIDKKD